MNFLRSLLLVCVFCTCSLFSNEINENPYAFKNNFCEGKPLKTKKEFARNAFKKRGARVVYYGESPFYLRVRDSNDFTGAGPYKYLSGIPIDTFEYRDRRWFKNYLNTAHLALGVTQKNELQLAIGNTKEVALAKAQGTYLQNSDLKVGLFFGVSGWDPKGTDSVWNKIDEVKYLKYIQQSKKYLYGNVTYPLVYNKKISLDQIKITSNCAWLFGTATFNNYEFEVAIAIER